MSTPTATSRRRAGAAVNSQVTVADYLAVQAGEAARAVRLAGLRPALDRQVGHPAESVGLVVAQEPPGGETLPRGGMVTLYVAAPAASDTAPGVPEAAERPAEAAEVSAARRSAVRPGRSGGAPNITSVGPTGTPPTVSFMRDADVAEAAAVSLRAAAPARTLWRGGGERPDAGARRARPPATAAESVADQHPAADSAAAATPSGEREHLSDHAGHEADGRLQLAQSMRDAFASPDGLRGKRRVYPREPLGLRLYAVAAWARRRWRRVLACAAVLVWLTFALVHRDQTERRAAPAPSVAASAAARRPRERARPRAARSTHRKRSGRLHSRPSALAAARTRGVPNVAGPIRPAPAPTEPAPAPTAVQTRAPAEQGGGPFSP